VTKTEKHQQRIVTAHHEAAHAVHFVSIGWRLDYVMIRRTTGVTKPRVNRGHIPTRRRIVQRLVNELCGPQSEYVFFGLRAKNQHDWLKPFQAARILYGARTDKEAIPLVLIWFKRAGRFVRGHRAAIRRVANALIVQGRLNDRQVRALCRRRARDHFSESSRSPRRL